MAPAAACLDGERLEQGGLADAADAMDEDDQRARPSRGAVEERALGLAPDEPASLVGDALADGDGHVTPAGVCAGCQWRSAAGTGAGRRPSPERRALPGRPPGQSAAAAPRLEGALETIRWWPAVRARDLVVRAGDELAPAPAVDHDADKDRVHPVCSTCINAVNSWREPPKW